MRNNKTVTLSTSSFATSYLQLPGLNPLVQNEAACGIKNVKLKISHPSANNLF